MSLPPGFLDELRSRTSLAHVVGRKVAWDPRKSNQGKGDMWAPCPFHQEKTASFHVDDRKGFYYCFGCQAKGDAIGFVQETENVGFMEAVEILAREAGMTMPAADPQARVTADRNTRLAEVMEEALRFFRLQLSASAAGAARDYLSGRGLGAEALKRFEIGFAPNGRHALWQHLTGKGIAADLIVECGMAIAPDDGGAPFDRFRDRIMFPIRDPRGRCIAFGGRAMSPEARAKYLNSPETPLFDKGRSLYNHGPARTAAGKAGPLIVAEGYMDVIALVEAGFGATVAPLGTAITASQLELLWRIAPEPVIALDGDKAGLRAAMRLIDIALPLLKPGHGLRFALLPEGQDPDDLLRAQGPAAMQGALDGAMTMVRLLWQRETEGQVFDSPERRAGLDKRLRELTEKIPDQSLKHHYRQELRDLQWQTFRPARRTGRKPGAGGWQVDHAATQSLRRSLLAAADTAQVETELRERVILATVICTPAILDTHADALADLPLGSSDHAALRAAILDWHARPQGTLRERLSQVVGAQALETLMGHAHVALVPAVRNPGNTELAALGLAEELGKLAAARGHAEELREAVEDIDGPVPDRVVWRLVQATEARNRATRQSLDDRTEYDTGTNGAKLNKDERSAFDQLIRDIDFTKSRDRSH
ncbi:DNA primase [Meridianimarinicoccus roseus]|uniref:DNA primase n=1 Tax=Meridianimarinicoccus roseus TaxID=2072018 RepID=A0A2V2LN77_9RHOB|nr:DNA primase [Meridianimarinicoccus roseus]PWR03173.1 DNA primase [Meridianimarinicoccus roseus]